MGHCFTASRHEGDHPHCSAPPGGSPPHVLRQETGHAAVSGAGVHHHQGQVQELRGQLGLPCPPFSVDCQPFASRFHVHACTCVYVCVCVDVCCSVFGPMRCPDTQCSSLPVTLGTRACYWVFAARVCVCLLCGCCVCLHVHIFVCMGAWRAMHGSRCVTGVPRLLVHSTACASVLLDPWCSDTHTLVEDCAVQYKQWVHTWSICQSNLQVRQRKLQRTLTHATHRHDTFSDWCSAGGSLGNPIFFWLAGSNWWQQFFLSPVRILRALGVSNIGWVGLILGGGRFYPKHPRLSV